MMNKKNIVMAALFLLVGVVFSACTSNTTQNASPTQESTSQSVDQTAPSTQSVSQSKEFTVKATNFAFDQKEIKVKKGDTVKINFVNSEGFHDWVVDEFSAKTKQLQSGQSETIEFVADKTGSFEYYCSVGQHRQMGMVGKLIVE